MVLTCVVLQFIETPCRFCSNEEEFKKCPDGTGILLGFVREVKPCGVVNWLCVFQTLEQAIMQKPPMIIDKRLDKMLNPSYIPRGLTESELTQARNDLAQWHVCSLTAYEENEIDDLRNGMYELSASNEDLRLENLKLTTQLATHGKVTKPLTTKISDLEKEVQKLKNASNSFAKKAEIKANARVNARDNAHSKEIDKLNKQINTLNTKLDKTKTTLIEKTEGTFFVVLTY
jgi:hypothetical protein